MTQEISYRLEFTFPQEREDREQLLPAIDLTLRSLEEADRLAAGALGLEMDYRRALRDMGERIFRYKVTLSLKWPGQILLGAWPDPESLREWMADTRSILMRTAAEGNGSGGISSDWHRSAVHRGLTAALVYAAPPEERLSPLLEDLTRSMNDLGGAEAIILS